MSKTIMILHLPEPKVRKKTAKAVQHHKDKTKYSRKAKRKGSWDSPQEPLFFLLQPLPKSPFDAVQRVQDAF